MNQFISFFPSISLRYQNTDQSNESIYFLFSPRAFPSGTKTLISQMNQFTSFFSSMFLRYQNIDQSNESIYFSFFPSSSSGIKTLISQMNQFTSFFPKHFPHVSKMYICKNTDQFFKHPSLASHPNKKVILPKSNINTGRLLLWLKPL